MSENGSRRGSASREVVRRHRRERQIIVFGVLLILLAALAVGAGAVYRGDVTGPFDSTFVTHDADFESDITLVCAPSNTLPLDPGVVAVRVLNGTGTEGLAGQVSSVLGDRGYVMIDPGNSSRGYDGVVRVLFGSEGVAQAYTVARNFTEAELVLDSRENTTVDIVVGTGYEEATSLRAENDSELDPERNLYQDAPCLPWTQILAEPAPRIVPENPAPTATPAPEAEEDSSEDGE